MSADTVVHDVAKKSKKDKKKVKTGVKSRSKTLMNQGIYISPSRIKYWSNENGLNREISLANKEIRKLESHEIKNAKGEKVMTELKPITMLSKEAKHQLALAEKFKEESDLREKKKEEKSTADGKTKVEKKPQVKKSESDSEKNTESKGKFPQKRETPYSKYIDLLSKRKYRFAKGTEVQLAAIACEMLHELLDFGMQNVLKQKQKILRSKHIVTPEVASLSLSCLYRGLPSWLETVRELELKAEAKAEKKSGDSKTTDSKATADTDVKVDDDSDDSDDNHGFKHYIRQVCHNIVNEKVSVNSEYDVIKVSEELRAFCSQLVIEFVSTVVQMLKGQLEVQDVRTVSPKIIKHVISQYMTVMQSCPPDFSARLNKKIDLYNTVVENRKKAEALKKQEAEASAKVAKESKSTDDSTKDTN